MDAIAGQAQVSKQTVYSHFANKDDLFRECIMSKSREYGLDMAGYAPDLPIDKALTDLGHRFLGLLDDEQVVCMHRVLLSETPAFPSLAKSFWETGPQAAMQALSKYLVANGEHGMSDITDPDAAASDFLLLVEGHYMKRRMMLDAVALSPEERDTRVSESVHKVRRLYDRSYQQ